MKSYYSSMITPTCIAVLSNLYLRKETFNIYMKEL